MADTCVLNMFNVVEIWYPGVFEVANYEFKLKVAKKQNGEFNMADTCTLNIFNVIEIW